MLFVRKELFRQFSCLIPSPSAANNQLRVPLLLCRNAGLLVTSYHEIFFAILNLRLVNTRTGNGALPRVDTSCLRKFLNVQYYGVDRNESIVEIIPTPRINEIGPASDRNQCTGNRTQQ